MFGNDPSGSIVIAHKFEGQSGFEALKSTHRDVFTNSGLNIETTYLWTHMRTSKSIFDHMHAKALIPQQHYVIGHNVFGPTVDLKKHESYGSLGSHDEILAKFDSILEYAIANWCLKSDKTCKKILENGRRLI